MKGVLGYAAERRAMHTLVTRVSPLGYLELAHKYTGTYFVPLEVKNKLFFTSGIVILNNYTRYLIRMGPSSQPVEDTYLLRIPRYKYLSILVPCFKETVGLHRHVENLHGFPRNKVLGRLPEEQGCPSA